MAEAPKPEKTDYESLLGSITSMEPTAQKINSQNITQRLAELKRVVEEELKDLVFQDYLRARSG